jgi:toxoflavin synthase
MPTSNLKIFISMPFSGKRYEDLYQERLDLKKLVESYGFELTEQFVGYQFKEDFESKDYDPKWVVGKDKNWLKHSDVVISDFSTPSMGTDMELILSKEVFNKPVYAVVPEERRFHPWLKFYCGRYFDSVQDALKQIKKDYPDGPKVASRIDKRQYDAIAGEYRLVEETPAQKYIYDENLRQQFEKIAVSDKRVVVLHSGSGYRARMAKEAGATQVLGVDLSYQNIRIAEDVEDEHPLGINYVSSDVYVDDVANNLPREFVGSIDLVVGYFAIDHAMNTKELEMFCRNVKKLLAPTGVFIGMSDCPAGEKPLPGKYGVTLSFDERNPDCEEGRPRRVSIFKNDKEVMHFHNFVWSAETIRAGLIATGFNNVSISQAVITDNAKKSFPEGFWEEYESAPDQIVFEAH